MNKYELALVVNAKLEEEERAAVVTKFSICVKHITTLFSLKQTQQLRQRSRAICVLWITY